ncbi:pheST operon leader peptide PheM [Serratia symbiotica]|uniref:pheST attenuator peptide n=1 Tax=Serratia symbiotica SCt-VLC TaxID=1347341 RepID=A0A068RCP7_9GAMM|nr:Phenylalanyl--tRNA ligase operon leader peptide [Serratia symbiotica SCt-VLC]
MYVAIFRFFFCFIV